MRIICLLTKNDRIKGNMRKGGIMQIGNIMQVYNDFANITTEEFVELMLNVKTQEERIFYTNMFNTILQNRQKKVIEANIF